MPKQRIIFDRDSVQFILEALGKTVDAKGFVIDSKTRKHVHDVDGKKFKPKKLIAVTRDHWVTKEIHLLKIIK